MKISIASAFLLASAASAIPVLRTLQSDQCDVLEETYPAGDSIAETRTTGTFKIPDQGAFQCNITCASGSDFDVYVKFGSSGSVSSTDNDLAAEGAACGDSFQQTNEDGNVVGLQWRIESPNPFDDISFDCACQTAEENPNSGSDGGGGCFSGADIVHVLNKGETAMKDLQVGDKILTGANKYEPVYSFGHYHETKVSNFVDLQTQTNALTMTPNHLIYVNGQTTPVRSDKVQVGDQLSSGAVKKVSTVKKEGLYMPLTPSGNVVVNNIKASAYISMADYAPIQQHPLLSFWLSEHNLSHLWLSPYRMYCMGVSSNYCPNHVKNADGDEGVMGYLLIGKKVAEFALEQNLVIQVLVGIPTFATLFAFVAVELVTGPSLAPIMVLLVAGFLIRMKKATGRAQKQKVV